MLERAVRALIPLLLVVGVACGNGTPKPSPSSPVPTATAGTVSPTPTASPTKQTMTVTPVSGLHSGQVVYIEASGFTPNEPLVVAECADKGASTTDADCNVGGSVFATSDAQGKVVADLPVVVGPFGANHIVCSKTVRCLVSVSQPVATPTEEADLDITFA